MSTSLSLSLFLLAICAFPLSAQPQPQPRRVMFPSRNFPPDIISQDELPRDIVRVAPSRAHVDFENDRTRVLRLSLGAAEALPTHDDRAGVLVCIAGCRLRFTLPDGKTQDLELKPGETRWLPEARRTARNLAAAAVELLYIETKRPLT